MILSVLLSFIEPQFGYSLFETPNTSLGNKGELSCDSSKFKLLAPPRVCMGTFMLFNED